jgi:hypothetical protein
MAATAASYGNNEFLIILKICIYAGHAVRTYLMPVESSSIGGFGCLPNAARLVSGVQAHGVMAFVVGCCVSMEPAPRKKLFGLHLVLHSSSLAGAGNMHASVCSEPGP